MTELVEHEYQITFISGVPIRHDFICVDKVGGGTLGKAYEGKWKSYTYNSRKKLIFECEWTTGLPKTHKEISKWTIDQFEFWLYGEI